MKDERAFQYYSRLLSLEVKQDVFVSLGDVAAMLCTTPRHSRTLLQALQEREWLNWTPKVGRNQRSILHLHYSLVELQHSLAKQLIEKGHYESALARLNGDQKQFSALLQQTSGATLREGQLHIQLTYQRIFDRLLPHKPLRNSERFLVRQIYTCLTACNNVGNVTPQLAHHWQCSDDATVWRFYLRPQLRCHSNTVIDAALVCNLFNQLRLLPEYEKELSHVNQISASHQCITFELNSPDHGFAALLSDLRYSIQPPAQLCEATNLSVDGCGPFQVIEQSDKRLRLQAFDHYFSLRSLTDTVTIWQFDHTPSERIQFGRSDSDDDQQHPELLLKREGVEASSTQTRIENGCLYLLFNMNNAKTPLSHAQRKYLTKVLSPELVLQHGGLSELLLASVPAYSLLPSWTKVHPQLIEKTALPHRLDIAVYDHQVILDCANVLCKTLNQMGIESQVNTYSFTEMHERAERHELQEAIIIASFNVDDNLPVSVFRWFLSNAILHQGLPADAKSWLYQELGHIRQQCEVGGYLNKLEPLATTLQYENWLVPLFHHRQTLRWQGVLQGVSMTDWSWPDFKNVWTDDK
ncbi:SgrR family transcriptional regulator [Photobacterium satsumensis]|uniref:SgrR family transcriptional regulator n=1 Tax=Photobacterium satsumensis TaxID=2910239 RepID=UPI003D0D005D